MKTLSQGRLFSWVAATALVVVTSGPAVAGAQEAADQIGSSTVAAADCRKSGWMLLVREDGTRFANQGACIGHISSGGTATYSASAACDVQQGTFSTEGPNLAGDLAGRSVIWVCNGAQPAPSAVLFAQSTACFDEGLGNGYSQVFVAYGYDNEPLVDTTCAGYPPVG